MEMNLMNALYAWFSGFAKKICSVIIFLAVSSWFCTTGLSQSTSHFTNADGFVRLKFIDAKGLPIAGVWVSPAYYSAEHTDFAITRHRSNEDGVLVLPIGQTKGVVSVWAQRRGYSPVQTGLSKTELKTVTLDVAPLYQGIVVDSMGNPVPNAKVFGYYEFDDYQDPGEPFLSDENGLFTVPWSTGKANFMATDGQGNYAQLINAEFKNNRLELRPSTNIEVAVRDKSGNMLENATVEIRSWNGCGCLKFAASSNSKGLVDFTNIPVGKLGIYVFFKGFRPLWMQVDSSQTNRATATLRRPQKITIRAVDSDTDQPIPQFKVTGYFSNDMRVSDTGPAVPSQLPKNWGWGMQGQNGFASVLIERFYDRVEFNVLAQGYYATRVTVVDSDDESIERVVRLQKRADGIEKIQVLSVDGKPAKDACIMWQPIGSMAAVEIGRTRDDAINHDDMEEHNDGIRYCDSDGIASFHSIPFEGHIIAWNKDGYFQGSFLDTDITAPIQLEPYVKLRLKLPRFLYSNPLNRLEVSVPPKVSSDPHGTLPPTSLAYDFYQFSETGDYLNLIDERGQIEMKVLPGSPAHIHIHHHTAMMAGTQYPLVKYKASPGEEIEIDLTGDSSIRGKLRFEWGGLKDKQLIAPVIFASTKNHLGNIYFKTLVEKNGSFEFTQIPPGDYFLSMGTTEIKTVQPQAQPIGREYATVKLAKQVSLANAENRDLGEIAVPLQISL
jgi:hypothetical protein